MADDIAKTLRRIAEGAEIPKNLRRHLLEMVGRVCYQDGDLKSMLDQREFCEYVSRYVERLFTIILSVEGKGGAREQLRELFIAMDPNEKKYWVALKRRTQPIIFPGFTGFGNEIVPLSRENALKLIELGLAEPLYISPSSTRNLGKDIIPEK